MTDTCRDIIDLLGEYFDGEMAPARRRAFEEHMAACPPCVTFLEDLRGARTALRAMRCESVPAEVQRALRAFLRRAAGSRSPR